MSVKRYKLLDMMIFAAIVSVLEVIVQLARNFSPGELFSFSATLAVSLIVFARWGAWGLIHAALGGAVFALAKGGGGLTAVIYSVGSMGAVLALLVPKLAGNEKLRKTPPLLILYTLLGFLGSCAGKAAMAFLLEGQLGVLDYLLQYLAADALNGIITCMVIYIAARQDGVLEWQLSYLRRIAEEEELKHGGNNPEQARDGA